MIYTSQQIRIALVAMAEIKHRPPFELCFVKSVIDAYRDNEHHPIKMELDLILKRKFPDAKPQPAFNTGISQKPEIASHEEFEEFNKVAHLFRGAMKALAWYADVDASTVSASARRGYISKSNFEKFKPFFKDVIREHNKQVAA